MNNLVFLLVILGAMSYENPSESSKLYQQSLLFHLETTKTDTVFVLKCNDIKLPSKIGSYAIVDISDNPKVFLTGKGDLFAVKIMPLEINRGNAQVTLIDYILMEENREVIMSNTGSEVFTYKYDINTNRYKLAKRLKNTL